MSVTFAGRCAHVTLAALALGAAGLLTAGTAAAQAPAGAPPPTVRVAPVVSKSVGLTAQFTGRIEAIQSVDVRARVEGYLKSVEFKDGANVTAGDTLYQIDPAPYQASLAQAQAELAAAKASVAGAEADLKNKELELERQKTLTQRNVVAQAQEDQAEADRDVASANLESAKAQVQQAEAAVTTAQLNLNYTTISAPVAGRMGKTDVTEGALITANGDTMATLVQLDPIRVAFAVPSTDYVTLMQETQGPSENHGGDMFNPSLTLPNGQPYAEDGRIVFASNQVDATTDTLTAYADFPNPQALLLPGQFVVVAVSEIEQTEVPVVPATAVLRDRDGPYVFVLNADNTAEQRRISVEQRDETDVAVSSGLTEGETIIVSGVQKVQPGMAVTPEPVAPSPASSSSASPSPASASPSSPSPASASP
ncbi:MAG: efflux RND transporter periplasmic adaptor subunit, partial [Pseudomonadota bacterium]